MKAHDLKCDTEFFQPLLDGLKPFDIRQNDREYDVGDLLMLHEHTRCGNCHKLHPSTSCPDGKYTGRTCVRTVTYKTAFAQKPGFIVMGLALPDPALCTPFTCALCEHEFTASISWSLDLVTCTKRICPNCRQRLVEERG